MRLKNVRWLSWVLVCMMLLTCAAQAEGSVASKAVSAIAKSSGVSQPRSIKSLSGVQATTRGKSVTYRFAQPYYLTSNKLTTQKPISKASVRSISLSPMSSVMGLYCDINYYSDLQPLLVNVNPSNANVYLRSCSSSNYDVVDWFIDDNDYIWFEAMGPGSATITVKTTNGKTATKRITVYPETRVVPFSSMSIGTLDSEGYSVTLKNKTLYAGDFMEVMAQPKPYTATYYDFPIFGNYFDGADYPDYDGFWTSAAVFSSSNESVATAMEGYVFAHKPGTATIYATARDGSKKKGGFKLTVKARNPDSISLNKSTLNLAPSATYQLGYEIDPVGYYDQKVIWSSDRKSVATVNSTGLITAVSGGTATITATTNTGKKAASCTVNVSYSKAANETKYRFYGIGNANYTKASKLPSCLNDLNIMAAAATDAGFEPFDTNPDRTTEGIHEVLEEMATNASIDDNDVTVFYYSGHGLLSDLKFMRGALCGIDGGFVTVDEVQSYLDRTPGTIVVILDSCLSGQYITTKSLSPAQKKAQITAFNSAWTSALSSSKTAYTSKALTSSAQRSRFKILTAAAPLESSYGAGSSTGFGWFTTWAAYGLGQIANTETGGSASGSLAADSNSDNAVTLTELYNFVKTNLATEWDPIYQQHVQVWPAGDKTAIVNKNA